MILSDRDSICKILPHDGDMCLLSELLEVTEEKIICSSDTHHDLNNPLRVNTKLYMMAGIEYASQVIALHGQIERLTTDSKPIIGFLASIRDVQMQASLLDEEQGNLLIEATQQMRIDGAVTYGFAIRNRCGAIMAGRLTTKLMMEIPDR